MNSTSAAATSTQAVSPVLISGTKEPPDLNEYVEGGPRPKSAVPDPRHLAVRLHPAPSGTADVGVSAHRYRDHVAESVLDHFSAPTRAWFEASFSAPTGAQEQGWPAIAARDHTLLLAPT